MQTRLDEIDTVMYNIGIDANEFGGTPCWIWTKYLGIDGYGGLTYRNITWKAHRFAYTYFIGLIPAHLTIDHLCKNTSCVNPMHMECVTNKENVMRGDAPPAINARKTHCIHGHDLNEKNVWIDKNGYRHCRKCKYDRTKQKILELDGIHILAEGRPIIKDMGIHHTGVFLYDDNDRGVDMKLPSDAWKKKYRLILEEIDEDGRRN